MARSIHVRLDDDSAAALALLRATSQSESDAVRLALREAAARRRTRASLREEVARLRANEDDVREMRQVAEQMAELAPDEPTD
jgi:hypothetical protein